jgi:hypothetical protein
MFLADFAGSGNSEARHYRPDDFIDKNGTEDDCGNHFGILRKRGLALKRQPDSDARVSNQRDTKVPLNERRRT